MNPDDTIAIVIEGQIYDDPTAAKAAFVGIVERLLKELPDQFRTRQNTEGAVAAMIRKENLYDHGIDEADFDLFWEAVLAVVVEDDNER